jgi:diguanylate cyclase (GGDEF)-like protein
MFVHMAALKERIARLRAEMRTDALTRVGNRIALDEYLSQLDLLEGGADAASSAVLFVDIDRFHAFNHAQGQEAGDEALRRVAAALALTSRTADRVFRRGGEEFVIVLPNTTGSDALRVAERHRRAVADLAIPHGGTEQTPIVTITICVATATSGTLSAAIERAASTAFAAKDLNACNVVLEARDEAPPVGTRRDQ